MSINHTGLHCDDCARPITQAGEWVRIKHTEAKPNTGEIRLWLQCEQCHKHDQAKATLERLHSLGMGRAVRRDAPTRSTQPQPTQPQPTRRSVTPSIRKPDL